MGHVVRGLGTHLGLAHPELVDNVLRCGEHHEALLATNAHPACLPQLMPYEREFKGDPERAVVSWKTKCVDYFLQNLFRFSMPDDLALWNELFPEGSNQGVPLQDTECYKQEFEERELFFAQA